MAARSSLNFRALKNRSRNSSSSRATRSFSPWNKTRITNAPICGWLPLHPSYLLIKNQAIITVLCTVKMETTFGAWKFTHNTENCNNVKPICLTHASREYKNFQKMLKKNTSFSEYTGRISRKNTVLYRKMHINFSPNNEALPCHGLNS